MENKAMDGRPSNNNTSGVWPSVKPFVNACLSGQLMILQTWMGYSLFKDIIAPAAEKIELGPQSVADIKMQVNMFRKNLPKFFLFHAVYTSAQFGVYETLTKKAAVASGGTSLTLYQEACCGLISGASAAFMYYPLAIHVRELPIEQKQTWNYRNLVHPLYAIVRKDGFLALWKGSGAYIPRQMALNMGLLASYNPSFKYLEESIGAGRSDAQLGAGAVSAFFAITCKQSWELIALIKKGLQRNVGKKHPYDFIPTLLFELFKPGGRFGFYWETFKESARFAPYCAVQRLVMEQIRDLEESNGF